MYSILSFFFTGTGGCRLWPFPSLAVPLQVPAEPSIVARRSDSHPIPSHEANYRSERARHHRSLRSTSVGRPSRSASGSRVSMIRMRRVPSSVAGRDSSWIQVSSSQQACWRPSHSRGCSCCSGKTSVVDGGIRLGGLLNSKTSDEMSREN